MESVQKVALLIERSNSSIIIMWRRVDTAAAWSSKRGTDHCFNARFPNNESAMNSSSIINESEVSNGSIPILKCVGKVMKLNIGDGS